MTHITGIFPSQPVQTLENCSKLRSRVDIERIKFIFIGQPSQPAYGSVSYKSQEFLATKVGTIYKVTIE